MRKRLMVWVIAGVAMAAVLSFNPAMVAAQAPAGGTQAPPIPRMADGKPNLTGIWQAMNTAAWDIQGHAAQKDIPAGLGVVVGNEIPYQPWAAEKKRRTSPTVRPRTLKPGACCPACRA